MSEVEFPRITIDYNKEIGDFVIITRNTKMWEIIFDYSTENMVFASVKSSDNNDTPVVLDITNIKDEPTVVQQTITRVLAEIIYLDYTDEMKLFIIAGPKRASVTQKTFDFNTIQPTINEEGEFIDTSWKMVISQNANAYCVLERHKDYPNKFKFTFPNLQNSITVSTDENNLIQLSTESPICGNPDSIIDIAITPVTVTT